MTTAQYYQETIYGHSGYEDRLPPPLHGEELIPLELNLMIRDGRRSLETEDQLVREVLTLLAVCGGPRIESGDWPTPTSYQRGPRLVEIPQYALPSALFWRMPMWQPASGSPEEEFLDTGYELLFKVADGLPVRIPVLNVKYEMADALPSGRLKFAKEPPAVELPIPRFSCPFAPDFSMRAEFRSWGYDACQAGVRVPNMATLASHMQEAHRLTLTDMDTTFGRTVVMEKVKEDSEQQLAGRRASDPRLIPPADVSDGPLTPIGE